MKKGLLILALVPLVVFLGCGQQQTITTTSTTTTSTTTTTLYASYFPLVPGRVMTYEVTSHSGATESTVLWTWTFGNSIEVTSTLEVYELIIDRGGTSTTTYYWREDKTGSFKHGSGSYPSTVETEVLLRYPLGVGATWESELAGQYTTVLTEESVTTDAGVFTCRKVYYPKNIPTYRWFAKDIGLIKEFTDYGGSDWSSREVVSKNF